MEVMDKKDKYLSMLTHALSATGLYTVADVKLFEKEVKVHRVCKGEFLLGEGAIAQSLFFNIEGAFIQYSILQSGEENIIDLHTDHDWFFNRESLAKQIPAQCFIKAYTNSNILEISIQSIHALIYKSAAFLQLQHLHLAHIFTITQQPRCKNISIYLHINLPYCKHFP